MTAREVTGRELLHGRVGDKLVVGTRTQHFVCGRLHAIEADSAVFLVGAERVRVPLADVESVVAAVAGQAEFAK